MVIRPFKVVVGSTLIIDQTGVGISFQTARLLDCLLGQVVLRWRVVCALVPETGGMLTKTAVEQDLVQLWNAPTLIKISEESRREKYSSLKFQFDIRLINLYLLVMVN